MTNVLVVDDAAVDRTLISGLLQEAGDYQVKLATNGAEALEMIVGELPDLVLTDLVMPEMDGLELVATAVGRFPHLPFILLTSKGSEEVAVRALKQGAASYVPKHAMATDLLETVRTVLAVTGQRRQQLRMLAGMTSSRSSFELENDRILIPPLVEFLQDTMIHMGVCDQKERTHLGIALEEALVNALYHGNLEMSSELRETDYDAYYALAAERRQQAPYRDRKVYVEAHITREQATFDIRDGGPGFDPSAVADPTDPENWEQVSGRGLFLMRTFMDEVRHNDIGNQVTLIKRRSNGPSNENGEPSGSAG